MKSKRKKVKGPLKSFVDVTVFILIVLLLTYILSEYVVVRIVVHNESMEKTCYSGDSILVDKLSYRIREPKRYEVVVFKKNGTGEELIKRIIGLPGERVRIENGDIYINDEKIRDIANLTRPEYPGIAQTDVILGVGEYFVLGDNREVSIDSRYSEVGNVTNTRMIGRAICKIWPLNRIGVIKSQ